MGADALEEAVETLKDLGLTFVQAKVYLALSSLSQNIASISECSKVPRTDLYRVLHELETKGLVERIIANPVEFKAISLNECLDILIQARTRQSFDLQNRAAKLRKEFAEKHYVHNGDLKSKFVLVPCSRVIEKIVSAINGSAERIDLLLSWKSFRCGVYFFKDPLKKAWNRNVNCRILTDYPQENSITQLIFYKKSPCKIRFLVFPPETVMGLYDYKEIFIIENPAVGLNESSALWSNNPSLISLAKQYYENLWLATKKDSTRIQANGAPVRC
jgi:sugar-specific transcriptional regulator TrmB